MADPVEVFDVRAEELSVGVAEELREGRVERVCVGEAEVVFELLILLVPVAVKNLLRVERLEADPVFVERLVTVAAGLEEAVFV